MIPLSVTVNLDIDPWTDLEGQIAQEQMAPIERVGLMPAGTKEGRATVVFLVRVKGGPLDGQVIAAETTLRLLNVAVHALLASPIAQMEDL